MTASTWGEAGFEAIVQVFGARTGITFPPSRWRDAEIGIRQAMDRAGVTSLAQYRTLLRTDADLFDDLVIQLTVGETYFFRHLAQWEVIRQRLLPEILRSKGVGQTIRAWSAGCASGEEAYSLAMLLDQEGLIDRTHVLATDISRTALEKSRRATYGKWSSLRGESDGAKPYLMEREDRFVVRPSIRDRVVFENLNLALDIYPSRATGTVEMDLILCRNVLIYFDPEMVQAVARRFFAALAPGGWLVTGATDPLLGSEAPFEVLLTDAGIVYRRPTVQATEPAAAPTTAIDGAVRNGHSPIIPGVAAVHDSGSHTFAKLTDLPKREEGAGVDRLHAEESGRDENGAGEQVAAWLNRIAELARRDPQAAEQACGVAVGECPQAAELHYLHAILLLEAEKTAEALQALRRCLYLDRSLAIAHFMLGSIWQRQGNLGGARRAYRNARDLCRALPADAVVPFSDQESAGRLAEAADMQLQHLDFGPRRNGTPLASPGHPSAPP